MHRPTSFSSLIGVALLSNLASGFSCTASVPPLPSTSTFLRNSLPPPSSSSSSCPRNPLAKGRNYKDILSTTTSSLNVRGGGGSSALSASTTDTTSTTPAVTGQDLNLTTGKVLASLWGSCGVIYILAKAIKRVLPIALEPFSKGEGVVPLTQFQLV